MPSDAANAAVPLIEPAWPGGAPAGVGAAMSTRHGGVSTAPWHSLNLGVAVGDEAAAVARNRARWVEALGARPVWLRQVHGVQVLRLDATTPDHPAEPADAAWTTEPGIACTVQVADCLPVLLATRDGRAVAAAHAGWRGLAAGVLEATVAALQAGTAVPAAELRAWLGPCIGPQAFEVGPEVLQGFGRPPLPADQPGFRWSPRADGSPRWHADLPALARERLAAVGVTAVAVHGGCTVAGGSDFFSFRRDGVTGRLAAAVWRRRA
jgi:YfiH family protein